MDDRDTQISRLAGQGLTFGPPPDWVIERSIPEAPATDASVRFLLSDIQIDITAEQAWTQRVVSQAISSAGVDAIASFSASYLPSFQRLIIHRIRLIRNGTAIDFTDPERFQVLRREPNLERRLYDGALTADLQLSDVRPGDALETWFTVVGSNPALKGSLDISLPLAFSVPVERIFARLRAPSSRRLVIAVRPDESTYDYMETEAAQGVIDRQWSVQQEPPFLYDESVPPWWAAHKRVNVEDDKTWSDIADLFRESYALAEVLPEPVSSEIARIEQASPSASVRAIEALRFVQSSVRYLAVSVGEGGFLPRDVEQIWTSRFGDCKDMSRLLANMLARLGVKSCPALVCTFGIDPDRKPAARPLAFNHCIVRAEIDGVVRWLDPTQFAAGGDFDRINQPDLGWALPLTQNADIERLPATVVGGVTLESNERITFGARASAPVDFKAETIFREWQADQLRTAIRREGLQALSEHRRKFYDRTYNGAQIVTPMVVSDDMDANEIKLSEHYTLDRAWRTEGGVARYSQDDTVSVDLQVLPQKGRKQPLWLGVPRRLRRTTYFVSPVSWPINPWDVRADVAGLKGYSTLMGALHSTREFQLEFDYAITRSSIQPDDFEEFLSEYARLREGAAVSLNIPLPGEKSKEKDEQRPSPNSAMLLVLVATMIVALVIISVMRSF